MQLEEQEYVEMCDERGPPRPRIVDVAEEDQTLALAPSPQHANFDSIDNTAPTPSIKPTRDMCTSVDSALFVATKVDSAQNPPILWVNFEDQPMASRTDSPPHTSSQLAILLITSFRTEINTYFSQMSLMSKLVAFCVISPLMTWILRHVSTTLAGFLRSFVLYVLASDTALTPQ